MGYKSLLLKCFESATKWFYPKHASGSVQVLKTAGRSGCIGLFQKDIIALKNTFLIVLCVKKYLERMEGKIRKHLPIREC